MVEVVKLKAKHVDMLTDALSMQHLQGVFKEEHKLNMEKCGHAYSVFVDGRIVMCAGVSEYWPGRGEAWALLDRNCRKEFLKIHSTVKRFFEMCSIRRIEAAVDVNYPQGHRWAKSLGFKLETPLARHFLPNGSDASIYVRVRN